ncbi:hypothetical protein GL912_06095 [Shigella sonnei]|nr:hypothetical protein [Shigella sonnei]
MLSATPSNETLFTLHYCYYIETLNNRLFRWLAHLLCFIQTVLAALLMTQSIPMQWGGFLFAMLIFVQMVYRPVGRVAHAAIQASRYYEVLCASPTLTESELQQRLRVIAQNDSPASHQVRELAYNCAAMATDSKLSPLTGWLTRLLGRLTSTPTPQI